MTDNLRGIAMGLAVDLENQADYLTERIRALQEEIAALTRLRNAMRSKSYSMLAKMLPEDV